jgi:hypothetical protein
MEAGPAPGGSGSTRSGWAFTGSALCHTGREGARARGNDFTSS